jgi:acetyl esterase/lipase
LRLWGDDIEAMRPEAQECVAAHAQALRAAYNDRAPLSPDLDRFARARAVRASLPAFPPHPAGVDREIDGVPCRVFLPSVPARAVVVHLHGGGMVVGSPQMNDAGNAALADRHGVEVVSIGYRTAPEHPHPAAIDDAHRVTRALLERSDVLLAGESAGAYLAVMTLLRLRDAGQSSHVLGAVLSYGVYDWGRSKAQGSAGLLDAGDPDFFAHCYLPDRSPAERRAPDVSPRFADLHDLAPAFVCVGTEDHLLDDSLALAARWAAAGNDTELVVLPDLPHSFELYRCGIVEACAAAKAAWFEARLPPAPVGHG